ncbi:MAG: type II toxin-antitoxin system HicA family toxin [Bacteroidales bacterium]|nr:type II toxin-antitoxin system HicA family toxin [Bacteroidales bacterium]
MKYNELAKRLRYIMCYDTGEQANGHPLWYSPITGKVFRMSNHGSQEVPTGTLNSIMKDAGLKR